MSAELALPLLAAADFLGVEHLKLVCVAHIEAELAIVNVCRALAVADKHDAETLKDTCVNFIVTHFSAVSQPCGASKTGREQNPPTAAHTQPCGGRSLCVQVHQTDGFKELPRGEHARDASPRTAPPLPHACPSALSPYCAPRSCVVHH